MITSFESFNNEVFNETVSSQTGHLLLVGDELISGGTKDKLMPKYNELLKVWKESGYRWTKRPALFKLVKEPKEPKRK